MALINLPGVSAKQVQHTGADTITECLREVRKGSYCCMAGDNGAITAYRDDSGKLRAQFDRYRCNKSDEMFTSYAGLRQWLKTWWPEMGAL